MAGAERENQQDFSPTKLALDFVVSVYKSKSLEFDHKIKNILIEKASKNISSSGHMLIEPSPSIKL